jgi:hypothetical protein
LNLINFRILNFKTYKINSDIYDRISILKKTKKLPQSLYHSTDYCKNIKNESSFTPLFLVIKVKISQSSSLFLNTKKRNGFFSSKRRITKPESRSTTSSSSERAREGVPSQNQNDRVLRPYHSYRSPKWQWTLSSASHL